MLMIISSSSSGTLVLVPDSDTTVYAFRHSSLYEYGMNYEALKLNEDIIYVGHL